jgi:hypothetical protein
MVEVDSVVVVVADVEVSHTCDFLVPSADGTNEGGRW